MSSTLAATPKGILPTVQVLRGIAALMVAYYHASTQIPGFEAYLWPSFWPAGSAVLAHGVDIFFVISGFIMLVSSRGMSAGDFMARRIIRIVPLYWLFTLTLILVATARPELFKGTVVTAEAAIKSLAFIPYFSTSVPNQIWPLLVPGWTLNYEMMFYLIFAAALFVPLRYRVALCTLAFAVLMAGRIAPAYADSAVLKFFAAPIQFEFVGGMVIGHLYLSSWTLPRPACLLLILGGLLLLVSEALHPGQGHAAALLLAYGLPSCLVVLGAVLLDKSHARVPRWSLPAALGDASYSIYLSHIFVLGALRTGWGAVGLDQQTMAHALCFGLAGMVAVSLGGMLCYRWVEKPMLQVCQRAWRALNMRSPREATAPPA